MALRLAVAMVKTAANDQYGHRSRSQEYSDLFSAYWFSAHWCAQVRTGSPEIQRGDEQNIVPLVAHTQQNSQDRPTQMVFSPHSFYPASSKGQVVDLFHEKIRSLCAAYPVVHTSLRRHLEAAFLPHHPHSDSAAQ